TLLSFCSSSLCRLKLLTVLSHVLMIRSFLGHSRSEGATFPQVMLVEERGEETSIIIMTISIMTH
ncbi:hypothetical protein GBF38_008544, partial [Nibea albiflora]